LIHQRHLTPSCGGHAPTAERTLHPARMLTESLTPRPELENGQDPKRTLGVLGEAHRFRTIAGSPRHTQSTGRSANNHRVRLASLKNSVHCLIDSGGVRALNWYSRKQEFERSGAVDRPLVCGTRCDFHGRSSTPAESSVAIRKGRHLKEGSKPR
jgi:hypothetical protein